MKALLIVALIALVSCNEVELQAQPMDVIKCALSSDVLFQAIGKIIDAIKSQDMGTIAMTILSIYPGVVDEIKKCLAVGEPVLEIAPWVIALIKVIGPIVWDLVKDYALPKLKQWCLNKYGATWYCNIIPA